MDYTQSVVNNHLIHKLKRLQSKIQSLQLLSQRFSVFRMLAFAAGALLTWLAAMAAGNTAGWLVFAASLLVFVVIVAFHQRLDNWIRKFQLWQAIYQRQLARSQLDWENLPYRSLPEQRVRNALEIDLDLTGPRSLHHLIDQSISEQGSQRLAHWLSHPEPDLETITRRQNWVKELTCVPRFGMRLQLVFQLALQGASTRGPDPFLVKGGILLAETPLEPAFSLLACFSDPGAIPGECGVGLACHLDHQRACVS